MDFINKERFPLPFPSQLSCYPVFLQDTSQLPHSCNDKFEYHSADYSIGDLTEAMLKLLNLSFTSCYYGQVS